MNIRTIIKNYLVNNLQESKNSFTSLINKLILKYTKENSCTVYDINNGMCDSFSQDLIELMGGYTDNLYELSGDMFFNVRDTDFAREHWGPILETEYGVWSKSMLDKYGYPPVDLKKVNDEINHVWIFYNGKHYDAEIPEGTTKWYELPLIKKLLNRYSTIHESTHPDYLKWKRKNVTLRGMQDRYSDDNGGMAKYGSGLYTAALGNKAMAKQYGKVYYVVNAIPKNAKVVPDTNHAEMFLQNLVNNFCKQHNQPYNTDFFYKNTTISKEMIQLGYDGLIIKGREMVNYTPPDNVKYFETENELERYYYNNISKM